MDEHQLSTEHIDAIRATVRKVAEKIKMDADSMSVDPRHCRVVENIVERQWRVAEFVAEWESDIVWELTGFDDGL